MKKLLLFGLLLTVQVVKAEVYWNVHVATDVTHPNTSIVETEILPTATRINVPGAAVKCVLIESQMGFYNGKACEARFLNCEFVEGSVVGLLTACPMDQPSRGFNEIYLRSLGQLYIIFVECNTIEK